MFAIPLYFQITAHASPVLAGFYLVPAVVGNTLGGVVSGAFIKRYGTYKMLTMVAAVITALCHTLRTVRWTGSTKFLESLYIFPGGFGTGIIHSSTFIAVQAATTDEEMAIAFAGSYLFGGFGSVLGITLGGSVMREVMFKSATTGLSSLPDGGKPIIERALSDYKFLESLDEQLQRTLVGAYVRGFRTDFGKTSSHKDKALYLADDA